MLVTAFGPFPGAPHNPSAEILADLERHWRGRFSRMGVKLVTSVLPVVHAIGPLIDACVAREKPDAIVHLGLAGRRRNVTVETRARNMVSTLKPDARGAFAARRAVVVTDSNVARHYGDDLMRAFGARGVELKLEVVPAGEASKSLRVVEELLDAPGRPVGLRLHFRREAAVAV